VANAEIDPDARIGFLPAGHLRGYMQIGGDDLGATRMTANHLALNESDDGWENRSRDPTAYGLAKPGADVCRTSSACAGINAERS
jgi:hypothetical protein